MFFELSFNLVWNSWNSPRESVGFLLFSMSYICVLADFFVWLADGALILISVLHRQIYWWAVRFPTLLRTWTWRYLVGRSTILHLFTALDSLLGWTWRRSLPTKWRKCSSPTTLYGLTRGRRDRWSSYLAFSTCFPSLTGDEATISLSSKEMLFPGSQSQVFASLRTSHTRSSQTWNHNTHCVSSVTPVMICVMQDLFLIPLNRILVADTSFVAPLVYAVMGSSRDIAIGPVAVVSLLLGTLLQKEIDPVKNPEEYLRLAFTATFFAGVIQAALGFFRSNLGTSGYVGNLVSLLSYPCVCMLQIRVPHRVPLSCRHRRIHGRRRRHDFASTAQRISRYQKLHHQDRHRIRHEIRLASRSSRCKKLYATPFLIHLLYLGADTIASNF